MKTKLTPKQDVFIREYSMGFNATKAAIKAGYSPHTARQQGSRLLTNVYIQQRLESLGLVGLYTLEDVAKNGKVEIARVYAAKTLVEMAYGKPKNSNTANSSPKINLIMNKI